MMFALLWILSRRKRPRAEAAPLTFWGSSQATRTEAVTDESQSVRS